MVIEVGETVVYPHHGAATITKMTTRTIKGVDTKYVKLKMHEGDLVVELPISNLEEVGVRDVIGLSDVEAVYNVLRSDTVEEPGNWSRRFKANTEKMGSGDVLRISEVVRDLWRRDKERGVSAGEKAMLAKARRNLISELLLALHLTAEETEVVLDEVLESALVTA
jgi:CarD family transcriptional regulator